MMRVFVGLGEGIGNVVMGLPLVDALRAAGHEVWLSLRPTPPEIREDLYLLVTRGRVHPNPIGLFPNFDDFPCAFGVFDAACLTHWWASRPGPLPEAHEIFVGGPPSADAPEILADLDAARALAPDASKRAELHVACYGLPTRRGPLRGPLRVGIHPGCKPQWRDRKVYPRWAEVTHRVKELIGPSLGRVTIVGTEADDAYCGEPHEDLRGRTTLVEAAGVIADQDVLVSGDSGLHHVAVALGVPTVALFGGSSVEKARHPDPLIAPVVLASETWAIDPREVARAAVEAASRSRARMSA